MAYQTVVNNQSESSKYQELKEKYDALLEQFQTIEMVNSEYAQEVSYIDCVYVIYIIYMIDIKDTKVNNTKSWIRGRNGWTNFRRNEWKRG